MIRPPARKRAAASRSVLKVPLRFTAISRSDAASSAIFARVMMPALFTSTSTPPNAALGGLEQAPDRRGVADVGLNVADVGLNGGGATTGQLDLADQRLGQSRVA
jgi:hypothetical protein